MQRVHDEILKALGLDWAAISRPLPEATEFTFGEFAGFWCTRPELTHIRAFARGRRTNPWAVLGNVFARVITAVGPQ